MKIPVTDTVYLSEIVPSDKAAFIEHLNEKEIYDKTLNIPYPYTETDADWWIENTAAITKKQGRPIQWAIREASGALIGGIGFSDLNVGKTHKAEIGYWIAKPYWGKGIATAAVRPVCGIGFSELKLSRLIAYVFTGNDASARVLENNAFTLEGTLRRHEFKDGQYIDAMLYGKLS